MPMFFIHLISLFFAGGALFLLWRGTVSADPLTNLAVATGFIVRALLGQALFWISWARLPFARSLQVGQGFWFFAMDAFSEYYPHAVQCAHGGVSAIVHYPRGMASVSFVQLLSVVLLLFGEQPTTGLLLNLFCFLGSSYMIIRWADGHLQAEVAARVAIFAIAFSPALILWSLQPLKDTVFLFLVVAIVAACAAWERVWTSEASWVRRAGIAAAMWSATYLIAGIRWYFALLLLLGVTGFAVLVIFRAGPRKPVAIASSLILIVGLSRAFLFGSGPYIPSSIVRVLTFSRTQSPPASFSVVDSVESARTAFERSGGATQIVTPGEREELNRATAEKFRTGSNVDGANNLPATSKNPGAASPPPTLPTAAAVPLNRAAATDSTHASSSSESLNPPAAASETAVQPSETAIAGLASRPVVNRSEATANASETENNVSRQLSTSSTSDSSVPRLNGTTAETPPTLPWTASSAASAAPGAVAPKTSPVPAVNGQMASANHSEEQTSAPVHAGKGASSTNQPHAETKLAEAAIPAEERRQPEVVRERKFANSAAKRAAADEAAVAVKSSERVPSAAAPALPFAPTASPAAVRKSTSNNHSFRSRVERLTTGVAAIVLPRSVGQRIGFYEIGGGKNLWWYSDLDTLVFDVVLFFAFFWLIRSVRTVSLRSSTFWFVAVVTLLVSVPLAYTVTNFGTLFRLREMIYIGLVLIPMALATAPPNQKAPDESVIP